MAINLPIGWIGTGVMGRWMCSHLMAKGHQATVYNRTKEKAQPLLDAGAAWAETLPELAEPIPLDDWRHAWQEWLRSRGVVAEEAASCRLERSGQKLHMYAPPTLLQRLRTALRPAVQGDIWLLAGTGRFREAVHVQLQIDPT